MYRICKREETFLRLFAKMWQSWDHSIESDASSLELNVDWIADHLSSWLFATQISDGGAELGMMYFLTHFGPRITLLSYKWFSVSLDIIWLPYSENVYFNVCRRLREVVDMLQAAKWPWSKWWSGVMNQVAKRIFWAKFKFQARVAVFVPRRRFCWVFLESNPSRGSWEVGEHDFPISDPWICFLPDCYRGPDPPTMLG